MTRARRVHWPQPTRLSLRQYLELDPLPRKCAVIERRGRRQGQRSPPRRAAAMQAAHVHAREIGDPFVGLFGARLRLIRPGACGAARRAPMAADTSPKARSGSGQRFPQIAKCGPISTDHSIPRVAPGTDAAPTFGVTRKWHFRTRRERAHLRCVPHRMRGLSWVRRFSAM
jgi:hypothetical protein